MSEALDLPENAEAAAAPEPVRVTRHIRADGINEVLNDPTVRPWVAPVELGALDMSPAVANPRNVLLMGEHGGVMFLCLAPGMYETHIHVLPVGRGEWEAALAKAALHWLYTHTDAYEVTARVPEGDLDTERAVRAAGLGHDFTRPGECEFQGQKVDAHIYTQRAQDWIREADGPVEHGRWFRGRLGEEIERLKMDVPPILDDENFHRHAGAAIEMAMNDQPAKGVSFYNRWALASHHPTISLVGIDPTVIQMGIGLLFVGPRNVELVRVS